MDEDNDIKLTIIRAVGIAQKHGAGIYEDSESIREAMTATSIILSSMGAAANLTMHQVMGLLMETYKVAERIRNEDM